MVIYFINFIVIILKYKNKQIKLCISTNNLWLCKYISYSFYFRKVDKLRSFKVNEQYFLVRNDKDQHNNINYYKITRKYFKMPKKLKWKQLAFYHPSFLSFVGESSVSKHILKNK